MILERKMTNQQYRVRDTAKHRPAKRVLSGVLGSIPGPFFYFIYSIGAVLILLMSRMLCKCTNTFHLVLD